MSNPSPIFQFTVSVNTEETPPRYTIYDTSGNPTSGTLTVTESNTLILYTLREDSSELQFVGPLVSGDLDNDLNYSITEDGQTIIFVDSDATTENICMKLVTAPKSSVYTSQDPQILNRQKN
ncbi:MULTISPECIES: DP-EP family protein [Alteromonas]|uniref:DP-EP family protein n=1 Tax=Alteromonas stellipolaris TaxID=233316 RepID=A0AAW7Z2W3_9ALTE|nr:MULTISPECIES: DP-EP family protein [Alteromonas]AMJ91257.1 hypothetical protein AV940_12675 [Alteromonas sp. Mac2]ALM89954.1 hypothetical protein AOR13_910 [Alteromonas stellipolaris LMG 21856]AMJ74990.1 hypothetical protein AVL57_14050 [Alteromonas stellipolaris]AMJ87395.1 hypothetical protein AV939_12915 [Alteromonas sp. Mac1]ANB21899.1 hypothetical protein A6K25_11820 [Alteromonas stellipolaris]